MLVESLFYSAILKPLPCELRKAHRYMQPIGNSFLLANYDQPFQVLLQPSLEALANEDQARYEVSLLAKEPFCLRVEIGSGLSW